MTLKTPRIAALLTAKGTSAFANKNITPVLGKPLLTYPATAARNSKLIDSFYTSSDSETILDIAAELGYRKIKRPAELAQPESQHIDAIKHALEQMQALDNYHPDILVVLLGNTATVKTAWIEEGIRHCIENPDVSAAVPVFQDQDHHPFRAKRVNSQGFLDTFIDFSGKRISTNRQDLEPCYFLCHNFWVLNTDRSVFSEGGQPPWTFMGSRVKPIVVDECFDIHDVEDIQRCEKWLQANI